jgi:hypothetical protein
MESILRKVEAGIDSAFSRGNGEEHSHSHHDQTCDHLHSQNHTANRYHSFAPPSTGNVKWYVDGCSYFWAVSEAIEREPPVPPTFLRSSQLTVRRRRPGGDSHHGLVAEPRALPAPSSLQE